MAELMLGLGRAAKSAAKSLAQATTDAKNAALKAAAAAIRERRADLLAANRADVEQAKQRGLSSSLLDRLVLNEQRVEAMARGIEDIIALPDPIGSVITSWTRPNGLKFERVRVPLGVVGIIYESRPNVTADAGALCLKSGNAVILRGAARAIARSEPFTNASPPACVPPACLKPPFKSCPPPIARRWVTCCRA